MDDVSAPSQPRLSRPFESPHPLSPSSTHEFILHPIIQNIDHGVQKTKQAIKGARHDSIKDQNSKSIDQVMNYKATNPNRNHVANVTISASADGRVKKERARKSSQRSALSVLPAIKPSNPTRPSLHRPRASSSSTACSGRSNRK
jgi:hypothetical protein